MPPAGRPSWGRGVGEAHAIFAAAYAFEGVIRLVNARRMSHGGRRSRPLMVSSRSWVLWVNFGTTSALTGVGALLSALPGSDAERGVGVTVAARGSWLLSYAIVQLVKARRGQPTWMARDLRAVRF